MRLLVVNFILIISNLGYLISHREKPGTRYRIFENFDGTCKARKAPVIINMDDVKKVGTTLIMNITVNITEDIPSDIRLLVNLERCKNKENLDTCEQFQHIQMDHFCRIIVGGSLMWHSFISAFHPKMTCPVKKNVHRAVNNEMNMYAFLLFPIEKWFWRIDVKGYTQDTNKLLLSVCTHMYLDFS